MLCQETTKSFLRRFGAKHYWMEFAIEVYLVHSSSCKEFATKFSFKMSSTLSDSLRGKSNKQFATEFS